MPAVSASTGTPVPGVTSPPPNTISLAVQANLSRANFLCWAEVALAIANYYKLGAGRDIPAVTAGVLNDGCAAAHGVGSACDKVNTPEAALDFLAVPRASTRANISTIQNIAPSELRGHRPIVLFQGKHCSVLAGIRQAQGVLDFEVHDPNGQENFFSQRDLRQNFFFEFLTTGLSAGFAAAGVGTSSPPSAEWSLLDSLVTEGNFFEGDAEEILRRLQEGEWQARGLKAHQAQELLSAPVEREDVDSLRLGARGPGKKVYRLAESDLKSGVSLPAAVNAERYLISKRGKRTWSLKVERIKGESLRSALFGQPPEEALAVLPDSGLPSGVAAQNSEVSWIEVPTLGTHALGFGPEGEAPQQVIPLGPRFYGLERGKAVQTDAYLGALRKAAAEWAKLGG
ncbi:MAG: papain-like cysteine protease family protein [Thermoanaerobaculia bacterium]